MEQNIKNKIKSEFFKLDQFVYMNIKFSLSRLWGKQKQHGKKIEKKKEN